MKSRPIPGFPSYAVTSNGMVLSGKRVLAPFLSALGGYFQVDLNGKRRYVHRLVAEAFCVMPDGTNTVNHRNGNKLDNRDSNLEWVTQAENNAHAYAAGLRTGPWTGAMSGDHNTSKAVVSTDCETGEQRFYPAAMDAVREGFSSSAISRCCHGLSSKHKGRHWAFGAERGVVSGDEVAA